jgi:hypothetical protein
VKRWPTPAQQMRVMLAEARERGVDFDVAWKKARHGGVRYPHDTATRRQWYLALDWARDEFEAAYKARATAASASFGALQAEAEEIELEPDQLAGIGVA